MSATSDLIGFATAAHRLPDAVAADATRLLADTLGVGAAGATAAGAEAIQIVARGWGAGAHARLIGSDERLPAASAAFVNGFRIHCLEWDAVHEGAVVHALSVVVAALGATIDRMGGAPREEALIALTVGVDIACGLGIAADGPLRFFRPATAGCIGAALACARVARVPPHRFADVLGLAYSSCAGTMQAHVEGSVALPVQVANAARAAVVAVELASAGVNGPHDVLEGPFGYFALFDSGDLCQYTRDIGQRWRISEVSTKPFPSGRASHGVLGALAAQPAGVVAVNAVVPPLVHRLVGRPMRPDMSPAYARLCLPFLAALMVRDGRVDPRLFTSDVFADPALLALAAQVQLFVDDNADPNALSPQQVALTLADGQIARVAIPATLGSPAAPLSALQAAAKRDLCQALAGTVSDTRLFDNPIAYFTEPA